MSDQLKESEAEESIVLRAGESQATQTEKLKAAEGEGARMQQQSESKACKLPGVPGVSQCGKAEETGIKHLQAMAGKGANVQGERRFQKYSGLPLLCPYILPRPQSIGWCPEQEGWGLSMLACTLAVSGTAPPTQPLMNARCLLRWRTRREVGRM